MSEHDAIAKRAYELFLERGSVPGYEVEDWLAAEAELTAATVNAATAASDGTEDTATDGKRSGGKRGSNRRESTPATRRSLRP
jgi:hypothetical protein